MAQTTWTAETIPVLRERLGMSQTELAQLFNKTRQTVTAWESGRRHVTKIDARAMTILDRLASMFEVGRE